MPNSLTSPSIRSLLDRLFQAAAEDDTRRPGLAERHPDGFAAASAREQADAFAEMYIPVSPEDGWKNLYLPVLRLLEPRLVPGALVAADDTISLAAQMTDYLCYVRDPVNGYLSIAFPESDGLEISCRV